MTISKQLTVPAFYVIVLIMRLTRLFRHFSLWIFLFAFLLRLLVGLSIPFDFESTSQWIAAKNIAHGFGYSVDPQHPTALRTPGYPFFLALLIKVFGEHRLPVTVFLALVGAINAVLCFLLAKRIFNLRSGLVAACLYTLTPYLAQQESTTQVGLVATGLMAGTFFFLKARSERALIFTLLSAFFFLCAYLTRPTVGMVPAFFAVALLIEGIRKKTSWHLVSAVIFFSFFMLGLMPWAIRNSRAMGQFHVAQTNFWYNVYAANHPAAFHIYPYAALDNLGPLFMQKELPPLGTETRVEQWYRQRALNEIKKVPLTIFLKRSAQKLFYLWHIRLVPFAERIGNDPDTGKSLDQPRPLAKNLAYSIPYLLLVVFALISCWRKRGRRTLLLFFAGFLGFFSLPHMITISYTKYTLAVYFVLIIFAADAVASLFKKQ